MSPEPLKAAPLPSRPRPGAARYLTVLALAMLLALLAGGCAAPRPHPPSAGHAFRFETDTFAYANGLIWEYYYDLSARWTSRRREPQPDYSSHCFAVARSARQFFLGARFDPTLPKADEATYRRLIRKVIRSNPAREVPEDRRLVIPGYSNLREFSAAWERLLKAESGGGWRSYFQKGHWRMVFPFSRSHQQATVHQLLASLERHRPPVVHVTVFPRLTINHALLLYDRVETGNVVQFAVYDPNHPEKPAVLNYDRRTRTFHFPANDYFHGGPVNIYEVYTGWCY